MFDLNENTRFFMCSYPVSMNKGIKGLTNLIMIETSFSPMSGDAYVFFSKDRKQVKILKWDNDGFILYQKRLVKGRFRIPDDKPDSMGCVQMSWDTFYLIMRGVRFITISYDKRYNIRTASGVQF